MNRRAQTHIVCNRRYYISGTLTDEPGTKLALQLQIGGLVFATYAVDCGIIILYFIPAKSNFFPDIENCSSAGVRRFRIRGCCLSIEYSAFYGWEPDSKSKPSSSILKV